MEAAGKISAMVLAAAQSAQKELYLAKREEKVEQKGIKKDFEQRKRMWREQALETEQLSQLAVRQEEKDAMKREFETISHQDVVLDKVSFKSLIANILCQHFGNIWFVFSCIGTKFCNLIRFLQHF